MDRVLVEVVSRKLKGKKVGDLFEVSPRDARVLTKMRLVRVVHDDDPLPEVPPPVMVAPEPPKRTYRRKVAEPEEEEKPKRTYRRRDLRAEE